MKLEIELLLIADKARQKANLQKELGSNGDPALQNIANRAADTLRALSRWSSWRLFRRRKLVQQLLYHTGRMAFIGDASDRRRLAVLLNRYDKVK